MAKAEDLLERRARIEKFLHTEFAKKIAGKSKVSVRRRRKFVEEMTRKIGQKFGKDVLCLLSFNKHGLTSYIVPAETEATGKGNLYQSFAHKNVFYTSHCMERFSERTGIKDNCLAALDAAFTEGLANFGEHANHLVCAAGVLAYAEEGERLIVKTFIGYDLLGAGQIRRFYSWDGLSHLPAGSIAGDGMESDFILSDELPES